MKVWNWVSYDTQGPRKRGWPFKLLHFFFWCPLWVAVPGQALILDIWRICCTLTHPTRAERIQFTICFLWLLEFKSVGIFAISLLQYFLRYCNFWIFSFFYSVLYTVQLLYLMNKVCQYFLQNIAFAPWTQIYVRLCRKYFSFEFLTVHLTVYSIINLDLNTTFCITILILKIIWISFFLQKAETHSLPAAFILHQ